MILYFIVLFLALDILHYYNLKVVNLINNININYFIYNSFKLLEHAKIIRCNINKTLLCIHQSQINSFKNILLLSSSKIHYKSVITFFYRNNSLKIIKANFINVFLTQRGTIHSRCWDITTNGGCYCRIISKIKQNISLYTQHDKVITIAHHFGNAIYHSIVECLPKIGYFIPQLLLDKSIKIHIIKSASKKFLNLLGFEDSRIVYGNIYVKRLLVPEKERCQYPPPPFHFFSLRYYLRLKIHSTAKYDIIIIKRIGKREIVNFQDVYDTLLSKYNNKTIGIYHPQTTFNQTMNYFKYAKLIVAPHGAGLSNIIVSSKDCKIIEIVTGNICYFTLSNFLGLEYYGIYENLTNNKYIVNLNKLIIVLNQIHIT